MSTPKTTNPQFPDAPQWLDYIEKTLGTNDWALCRKTKRNLAQYEVCLAQSEYAAFQRLYLKDGGDPEDVCDDRLAEECGWVRRWVRIAPEAGK